MTIYYLYKDTGATSYVSSYFFTDRNNAERRALWLKEQRGETWTVRTMRQDRYETEGRDCYLSGDFVND